MAIVATDVLQTSEELPVPIVGLLDEPAHVLTALLFLAVVPVRRQLVPWAVVGAVAIDADHVPMYLWGISGVSAGRPATHSLGTVVVLVAAAGAHRGMRTPALGLALGVSLHFARDLATGPGLPVLWPLSATNMRLPYWAYVAGLTALAAVVVLRPKGMRRPRRSRAASGRDRDGPAHFPWRSGGNAQTRRPAYEGQSHTAHSAPDR